MHSKLYLFATLVAHCTMKTESGRYVNLVCTIHYDSIGFWSGGG